MLIINKTLSQDDGKIIMGKTTKTGNKKISKGQLDENLLTNTAKRQLKIAKSNFNNKEYLLFCQLDGKYIDYTGAGMQMYKLLHCSISL